MHIMKCIIDLHIRERTVCIELPSEDKIYNGTDGDE